MEKIGTWAFLLGVLIAVIAGLVPAWRTPQVIWVLVILGLIVGLLNVKAKEVTEFLVASVAILIVASMGALPALGVTLGTILDNIIAFVGPSAMIVALKAIWDLAED